MTDRSEGGSSLESGTLELLVCILSISDFSVYLSKQKPDRLKNVELAQSSHVKHEIHNTVL